MKSVMFGVWCALLGLHVLDAQDLCKTPTDLDGNCIPIDDCEKLKPLVQKSPEQREYLKQWTCGFNDQTPLVCCPKKISVPNKTSNDKCITFSGQQGKCKPLNSCPFLQKKLKTKPVSAANLEYVQRSRCDLNRENYFCCDEAEVRHAEDKKNVPVLPDRKAKQCGVDSSSNNKIIGGSATAIDAYPWMGVIEYTETGRSYLCAGSLINDRYVLTAAHCLVSNNNRTLGAGSVRFGDYNVTNEGPDCVDTEGGGRDCTKGDLSIKIESVIVHPEYDNSKELIKVNDIALIRLMEPVIYDEFIRPICLPETDITTEESANITLAIAGWGYKNETHYSDVKLEANIELTDREICVKKYSRGDKPALGPSQICAGGGEKDVCGGDSGGPLSYFNEIHEVVGIISFGPRQCATIDRPSVYTKVFDYLEWIKSNIEPYDDTSPEVRNVYMYGIEIDDHPWIGIIEYPTSCKPYLCTGALINNRYVLVAAHCLVDNNHASRRAESVRFGEYDLNNEGPDCVETAGDGIDCTDGGLSVKIESVIVHPEYNNSRELMQVNDIALIRLMEPVPFNDFMKPVVLPETDITKLPPDSVLVAGGWNYRNTPNSVNKLWGYIHLADRDACVKKFSQGGKPVIGPSQVCVGGGEKDLCGLNLWGPLTHFYTRDYIIDGVLSFGSGHCSTVNKTITVYTKVYDHLNWIKKNMVP